MNHLLKILSASVVVLTAAVAQADTLTLKTSSLYSYSNGGAFIATPTSGSISNADYTGVAKITGGGFLTFCLEYNEYFDPGSTQYNYTVSTGARNGGVAGAVNGLDGISNATAWLYSEFAKGTLAGVAGFTYSNTTLGYRFLQQAIWQLEGEVSGTNALAAWAKSNVANASADSNGSYGVYALNITYPTGARAQDQLYYHVPDQGLTVAFLGLSLIGLAGLRRFCSRAK